VDFAVEEVQVAVKVMNVWGLSAVSECFRAELRVCSRWKVPELQLEAFLASNPSLRGAGGRKQAAGWVPDWVPNFSVWGCVERQNGMREYKAYRVEDPAHPGDPTSDVWVEGMEWFTVVVTEVFELKDFPFDVQDLNIHLSLDNAGRMALPTPDWLAQAPEGQLRPMVRYVKFVIQNFKLRRLVFRAPRAPPGGGSRASHQASHLHVVVLMERQHRFVGTSV
jgi:hypothetical protein